MEDTDVSLKMKREFFEKICEPLLSRIKATMEKALSLSELTPECLYSVELVGGGTRIPAVKRLVKEVFGKEGSTTLNADEAVARGCALQVRFLSKYATSYFVLSPGERSTLGCHLLTFIQSSRFLHCRCLSLLNFASMGTKGPGGGGFERQGCR